MPDFGKAAYGMMYPGYEKMDYTIESGYYVSTTGAFTNSPVGWQSIKVKCNPGDKLRVTVKVAGDSTAMAVFFNANGGYLSYLNRGANGSTIQYTDYEFTVPNGAYSVAISGNAFSPIRLERFESLSSKIDNVKNLTRFFETVSATTVTGFYMKGTGALTTNVPGWHSIKVPCSPGERYRVTVKVAGDSTAMALFYTSADAYLSFLNSGSNSQETNYVDYEFTVPSGAYSIAISGVSNTAIKLQKSVDLPSKVKSMAEGQVGNYWSGKKIVWFGTSIPESGYPQIVGTALGANMYNVAVGSSPARAGCHGNITSGDPLGWTGAVWQNVAYSLSQTLAEKEELITNWDTWKTKLTGSPPTTLSETEMTKIRNCSYENKLVANHLGEGKRADLYVFDHGHNDNWFWNATKDELKVSPTDQKDRTYFIGAMNFLIDLILKDNPRARILFVGHYENQYPGKTQISEAQQILADQWNFPFLKLWEKLGWSQKTVQTTGYWDASGNWIESGGPTQTLTMTQIWMKDNLHPYSTKAKQLIADTIVGFMSSLR
ncbi:hypothetical protein [Gorillibacterium sp. sgz5001074]|uniref:hypothetical protein n=1 Tax=Gorillibacterium sp. sgz5001074 TaxID=3446695 RepID=UPI003F668928